MSWILFYIVGDQKFNWPDIILIDFAQLTYYYEPFNMLIVITYWYLQLLSLKKCTLDVVLY